MPRRTRPSRSRRCCASSRATPPRRRSPPWCAVVSAMAAGAAEAAADEKRPRPEWSAPHRKLRAHPPPRCRRLARQRPLGPRMPTAPTADPRLRLTGAAEDPAERRALPRGHRQRRRRATRRDDRPGRLHDEAGPAEGRGRRRRPEAGAGDRLRLGARARRGDPRQARHRRRGGRALEADARALRRAPHRALRHRHPPRGVAGPLRGHPGALRPRHRRGDRGVRRDR